MRLGTEADLKIALQRLGLSGRLNTALIERENLTVRHAVAALARRTWATAQQSPHLLAYLEYWRAYYHFVRPPCIAAGDARSASRTRWQASCATLSATDGSSCSWENSSTLDGARGALSPIAASFRLRATQARCSCRSMCGEISVSASRRSQMELHSRVRWPVRTVQ